MAQTTDKTAHFPLFLGATLEDGRVIYQVVFYCDRRPSPGDQVTTKLRDVTCAECRRVAGENFRLDPTVKTLHDADGFFHLW